MTELDRDERVGLLAPLLSDGRPLLTLGTLGLLLSGGFAIFLAASGQFLPHDIHFLGMTPSELCSHDACRIVHFMIHDRVAFGGALIALSVLYFWLIQFPLRAGLAWAWWVLLISNVAGFGSFLMYLGFGYLDTWHALATVLLLPCFAAGLAMTYRRIAPPRSVRSLLRSASVAQPATRAARIGRFLLMATGAVMTGAGLTIAIVGMTVVFVPQDLEYMDTTRAKLNALNSHLVPLTAHDRAGFGGAVLNVGFLILACTWRGKPSRSLWQALALAGGIGFTAAIAIHPIVGYNNPVHLAPACVGALAYTIGIWLSASSMLRPRGDKAADKRAAV
jgi:hypothetical protein